ncbi:relaxase/mobilization nuclease domain-containing protein [Stenotrophomonas oahuensis]|uniref:Relaxase/mobilization nuclease domain-containing protein n=1 Tax=Stenotrophomonas oahuensis TaxID=3003271 RepID=A0ABY9YV94_9GAMM|nr:relaxase/mobilization nuclease domain-containing protein [Stenotrophomonas sp. A5586]WNH54837.1 relaxase/mobilization nuclease domain-containing protein [Stenotrophomonas sp. A5586]
MAKKRPDFDLHIGPQPITRRGANPYKGTKPKKSRVRDVGMTPARMQRILNRAPEAVVRITGGTWGAKHLAAHLGYIHRHGKLEGETSDGSLVIGADEVRALAKEWFARREVGPNGRQERSKETVNIVFSMPSGTPRAVVTEATRSAATRIFGGQFDYVMVTHTDTDDPHVHVTALARGLQGQRLLPNPEDLHRWRETFAEELRLRGVEAEATPRELRGVVQVTPRNAVYQIEKRLTKQGGLAEVRVEELHEAVLTVTGQLERGERPWENATKKRLARVQAGWIAYAEKIEQLGDPMLNEQARQIREFVAAMPEPLTRRERVERDVGQAMGVRTPGVEHSESRSWDEQGRG